MSQNEIINELVKNPVEGIEETDIIYKKTPRNQTKRTSI